MDLSVDLGPRFSTQVYFIPEIASLHMNLTKAQRLRTTSAGLSLCQFRNRAVLLLRPPPKQRTACCEAVRSRLVREHVPGRGRVEPCAVATCCADLTARANSATSPAGAGARCIAPHFRLPGGRRAVQQNSVCCLRMRPASDNSPVCRAWSPACVAWRLCTLAPDFPGPNPCSPGGGQRMCPSSVSHGASSSYLPPGRASGVYGDWGHSC